MMVALAAIDYQTYHKLSDQMLARCLSRPLLPPQRASVSIRFGRCIHVRHALVSGVLLSIAK